jgi:predicted nucleic acid-binding protein
VEVAAGLRRGMLRGALSDARAVQAIEDYLDLPVTRHGHQGLLGRILGLRENFSPYDATYVALTEQLGGELLTADERLARAAQVHAQLSIAGL